VKEHPVSVTNNESGTGFIISDEPVVRTHGAALERPPQQGRRSHTGGADLLYAIARDPKSLFLYWEVNWTRVFGQAGLTPRQVFARIYREDGAIEATREINPFLGHCYSDVAAAGTGYYCEIGCFDQEEWIPLARSGKAVTPEDSMSDDLSARFATLPMHLSFQRLLDILRETNAEPATLAESLGQLQDKARNLGDKLTSLNREQLAALAAVFSNEREETSASDFVALLEATAGSKPLGPASAEQIALWRQLGEQLGGASPSGSSGLPAKPSEAAK
jgi:uncharacterized coiled-coil protein SlyX